MLRISRKEFMTVVFKATMSVLLINGIFSFLSSIDSIEKRYRWWNGLKCYPHNGDILYDRSNQCNDMADKMYTALNGLCHLQGLCEDGYMDVSDGSWIYSDLDSQCGSNCTAGYWGKIMTFKNCTCACQSSRSCAYPHANTSTVFETTSMKFNGTVIEPLPEWGCGTDTINKPLYRRFSLFR
eukprot:417381_1